MCAWHHCPGAPVWTARPGVLFTYLAVGYFLHSYLIAAVGHTLAKGRENSSLWFEHIDNKLGSDSAQLRRSIYGIVFKTSSQLFVQSSVAMLSSLDTVETLGNLKGTLSLRLPLLIVCGMSGTSLPLGHTTHTQLPYCTLLLQTSPPHIPTPGAKGTWCPFLAS